MSTPSNATATSRQRARAEFWDRLKELARPLIIYWVFLLMMFGAFSVAALLDAPSAEGLMFLGFFGLVTFSSVATGQALALLRVRDWVLFGLWAFVWTVGMFFGVLGAMALGAAVAPLAILLMLYLFLGPMFTIAGAWSLRTGRAIFSAWVPLMYASATTIIMAENSGRVSNWHSGSKWAVWDVFTFGVLGVAIALLLAFLVAREGHRLHLWRRSKRGMLKGTVKEIGAARPRLSCLGWVLLCLLAGGLSVGTAAVAPYLWRTGPSNQDGGDPYDGDPQDPNDPQNGQGGEDGQDPADQVKKKVESVAEEVQENLQPVTEQGLDFLSTFLILLLLALLALLVFYRPVKRLVTVRHLRQPLWQVAGTGRIENAWRMVEIAMGDAGVPPRPGEAAVSLARRALPALQRLKAGKVDVHGLEDAAEVRDRIAYGLGVGPNDLALMERVADWAYDTVWDRLGDRGQLKAMYRGIG